jgi:hypothetical protein
MKCSTILTESVGPENCERQKMTEQPIQVISVDIAGIMTDCLLADWIT